MAVSADVGNKLIGWVLAGAGTLLAYSAIRNRKPWDVLRDIQGGAAFTTAGPQGFASGSGSGSDTAPTGDFSSTVPRIRMIANRELVPTLVAVRPHGRLDKDAAASLERIHAAVGRTINNVGTYRSFAEQAALFYGPGNVTLPDGSRRFGNPNKSLHVVGLAIDVANSDIAASRAAFAAEGWRNARPSAEPWHWSYLVSG